MYPQWKLPNSAWLNVLVSESCQGKIPFQNSPAQLHISSVFSRIVDILVFHVYGLFFNIIVVVSYHISPHVIDFMSNPPPQLGCDNYMKLFKIIWWRFLDWILIWGKKRVRLLYGEIRYFQVSPFTWSRVFLYHGRTAFLTLVCYLAPETVTWFIPLLASSFSFYFLPFPLKKHPLLSMPFVPLGPNPSPSNSWSRVVRAGLSVLSGFSGQHTLSCDTDGPSRLASTSCLALCWLPRQSFHF